MYEKGVTCSDCHNPHSLELKAEGDNVCLQCHTPDYATEQHHFHEPGTPGSQCVDCHMPAKTFMQVDARRDHSFRIPRPDLSDSLGTPNACNQCHTDKDAAWATETLKQWYGHLPSGHQQFAHTLHAARQGRASSQSLARLLGNTRQPDIARATAAHLIGSQLDGASIPALAQALNSPSGQIRQAAITALQSLPLNQRWSLLAPLLNDPQRVVRISAAEALADVPVSEVPLAAQQSLMNGFKEFEQAQAHNADTPSARVKLANFLLAQGYEKRAEEEYRQAIQLDRQWMSAYVNLADLYRRQRKEEAGEKVLMEGLKQQPANADLNHAMGLLKVRQKASTAALDYLHKAATEAPDNSHYQYVYAIALDSYGQRPAAINWLRDSLERRPAESLERLLHQWKNEP